ncbi:hypothetical protein ACT5AM_002708 [Cronobacter malonaticus]
MRKILLILLAFSSVLYASPYPVITSVRTTHDPVSGMPAHEFIFTQAVLDIGPAADQIAPAHYIVGLAIHYHANNFIERATIEDGHYEYSDGETSIGELALQAYNAGSKATTSFFLYDYTIDPNEKICLGYMGGKQSPGLVAIDWSGDVMQPGGCMIAPPADDWCKLTTPEIVLDHGNLTLKNAEGDTASANINLQCTVETAVTFNLITQDNYVYLDEGKSEITVDDKPLNTSITLPQGNSSLMVKDLLTGVTKEGYHTGSSVLVMMPY